MLLQCYFAHQTCMLFKWQDCTHILGSEEALDMTAEGRWSLGLPPCLVGEEYCAAWDCGVGTTDRVLIMVSAASLLQVRGGDRALPVDLGWMGATSTRGWGWKSGFVPPTGSAKEGYHFFPAGWWGKTGLHSQTHRREVQLCDCRVGWKTGIFPQASAAASTGAGEQRGFVMVPTWRMQMH